MGVANVNPFDRRDSEQAGAQAAEMITDGEFGVKDQTVVEMGAGTGLPSIISVFAGAKKAGLIGPKTGFN